MRFARSLSVAFLSIVVVAGCATASAGWTYAPAPSVTPPPAPSGSAARIPVSFYGQPLDGVDRRSAHRTIRNVPPDLTRRQDAGEIQQEGNLLIEGLAAAQRQRETETWVSEHLWQAEQRAIESERRYAESSRAWQVSSRTSRSW